MAVSPFDEALGAVAKKMLGCCRCYVVDAPSHWQANWGSIEVLPTDETIGLHWARRCVVHARVFFFNPADHPHHMADWPLAIWMFLMVFGVHVFFLFFLKAHPVAHPLRNVWLFIDLNLSCISRWAKESDATSTNFSWGLSLGLRKRLDWIVYLAISFGLLIFEWYCLIFSQMNNE